MVNEKRITESFMRYISIDSESCSEGEISKLLCSELANLGFSVTTDDSRLETKSQTGNIIAYLDGDESREPILLSAHMDTVTPGKGIKASMENGVIKSNGKTILGSDDKSGIAAIIEAVKAAQENNIPTVPIEVVFSVCEEIGLLGIKNLDFKNIKSKKAVVLDGGGEPGHITVGAPGQLTFKATITGKAAHAGGEPENGISAIIVAANAISKMKLLRVDKETTANIGTFEAHSPTNIVAESAVIIGEVRSRDFQKLQAECDHIKKCLEDCCKKQGAQVVFETTKMYENYKHDENLPIIKEIKEAGKKCNLECKTSLGGGGSDANIMNINGVTAVVVGTGMNKVHTVSEEIKISHLTDTAKLVLELIKA